MPAGMHGDRRAGLARSGDRGYGVADIYLGEFSPHPGHPDFTNTAAHADDEARFYDSDRPQAYVHARGG